MSTEDCDGDPTGEHCLNIRIFKAIGSHACRVDKRLCTSDHRSGF